MIGQTVSHYKILEKLGGGGMGVVYKAQDLKLDRFVALKFLPPESTRDPEAKTRFIHEAKAASALQHNNICTVHDIDESPDGQIFIVMDLYEGETLKKKIQRGPLKPEEATGIAVQIAQGLAEAHQNGIVHRDIKPANVLITKNGVAKIVDFGLAKLAGRTLLTKSGTTVGTAAYMSPEQARGEKVDHRSDIWSLGVVLYEMLIGKRPFDSDYEQALVYSILNEKPKPMLPIKSDIPVALEAVVRKAMAKNPEERYQTIVEMLADLELQWKGAPNVRSWTSRPMARRAVIVFVELAVVAAAIAAIILLTAHTPEIHKVAVLPFVDTSKDSAMAGVFDGLTEDVITNIGQLSKAMKVISFNGVVDYKEKHVTPVEAGEELGVDAIAVCRVYPKGNNYSLRLEIVNVRDNTSMANERFNASRGDIILLHRKMATSILKTFGVTISEDVAATIGRQQTKNFEAYRLYQQGNYHYHRLTEADLRMSIAYYRKALAIDTNYALAHAGIALSYFQLEDLRFVPWKQVADSAMSKVRRALAIDDKLPEAHSAAALFRLADFDLRGAAEETRRAMELNPSYADAFISTATSCRISAGLTKRLR